MFVACTCVFNGRLLLCVSSTFNARCLLLCCVLCALFVLCVLHLLGVRLALLVVCCVLWRVAICCYTPCVLRCWFLFVMLVLCCVWGGVACLLCVVCGSMIVMCVCVDRYVLPLGCFLWLCCRVARGVVCCLWLVAFVC